MALLAATLLLGVLAAEKYSLLDHTDAIVRGSLQKIRYFPNGRLWRAEAELLVIDSLRGGAARGDKLRYFLNCSCCAMQPSEKPLESLARDGMWLLRRDPSGKWTSAGSCADPGWRSGREWDGWRRAVQNSPPQGMQSLAPPH
jgi:hypothetical protein